MNKFIFTCGDINGIGPEIIIKSLNKLYTLPDKKFTILIPLNVFESTAEIIKPKFNYKVTKNLNSDGNNQIVIYDLCKAKQNLGHITKEAGKFSYKAIRTSYKILQKKYADAVITAPISKTAINKFGIKFPGHTEMYSSWCGINNYVMMFLSNEMNAALATIHEPVKKIPLLITKKLLLNTFTTVKNALESDLGIKDVQIAVLGLNPHAGESGLIGNEEIKIIKPAINKTDYCKGPFSPDAFFANKLYKNFNCVIGMYHDQILIPFKLLNFSSGVNYTAGLPIVRTSPDHGTAFDIAGKGIANELSLIEAFQYADLIVTNRKING
jgi:4-hydroxythreonine-4-phosphate dehydrogenase